MLDIVQLSDWEFDGGASDVIGFGNWEGDWLLVPIEGAWDSREISIEFVMFNFVFDNLENYRVSGVEKYI